MCTTSVSACSRTVSRRCFRKDKQSKKTNKKNSTNANILYKFALVTFWKSLDECSSYSCFFKRAGVVSYGVSLYIFSIHVFIIHVVIYFLSYVESVRVFVFTEIWSKIPQSWLLKKISYSVGFIVSTELYMFNRFHPEEKPTTKSIQWHGSIRH